MKNCFMKKLLSSFLALTMVATVVPANVVSAAEGQTQVVKDQNKQSQAKKASKWSDKTKTGLIAGCAAFLLAAIQANLYFKLNLAKKEAEELKNGTANPTNEKINDQLKKAIEEMNGVVNQTKKLLSEEWDQAKTKFNSLENNANMTALKLDDLENNMNMTALELYDLKNNMNMTALELYDLKKDINTTATPQMDSLANKKEPRMVFKAIDSLVDLAWRGASVVAFLQFWVNRNDLDPRFTAALLGGMSLLELGCSSFSSEKAWEATKYGFGKAWNATPKTFANLFKGNNSTLTNITKAGTEEKNNTESVPTVTSKNATNNTKFSPSPTPAPIPTR